MAVTKLGQNQLNDYNFNNSLSRQAIINGNFDVWQRGTSFTFTSKTYQYVADRWTHSLNSATNADIVVSRQAIVAGELDGSNYCIRIQRPVSSTYAGTNYLQQALESNESKKFIGKKLTVSFWARRGADYANTFRLYLASGTGTDQRIPASFSGLANLAKSGGLTLNTTWTQYTFTTSEVVADTVTQLGIWTFPSNYSGTAGANDYMEIAQVQLCAGDVALPFMPKSYEDELRACQRYFYKIGSDSVATYYATGMCNTTTIGLFVINFPVEMRIAPTSVETTGTATNYKILTSGDTNNVLNAVPDLITAVLANKNSMLVRATVASGLTAGQACLLANNSANAYLAFSAEL